MLCIAQLVCRSLQQGNPALVSLTAANTLHLHRETPTLAPDAVAISAANG